MKKKILSATFMVAMMAVAGYNVYMNQTKNGMSELALANVEALAGDENTTQETCGTHTEVVNNKKKCEMDNSYSQGFIGVVYSRTTGNELTYREGRIGSVYNCMDPSGIPIEEYKDYKCNENCLSGLL